MRLTPPSNDDSLSRYLQTAATFAVSVFVSAAAAEGVAATPPIATALPALAMGVATAAALPPCYRLLSPPPPVGDSAAMLRLPPLTILPTTAKVAVLGGSDAEGGIPSPLLCHTLTARNLKVTPVVCYQRLPAAADASLADDIANGGIAAAVAYSGDTLRFMLAMVAPNNNGLRRLPLFVVHDNIAAAARREGFTQISVVRENDAVMATKIAVAIGVKYAGT